MRGARLNLRVARIGAALLCGWAATAGCSSDPSDGGSEPTVTWTEAFDAAAHGALSGVWGSAPNDVWVAGGRPEAGEMHHFDGKTWTQVPLPAGTPLLSWVYGFSATDAWAVGTKGAVLRWDGTAWKRVASGTTADLWGVWGPSSDDLWMVGGTVGEAAPVILRWHGGQLGPVALDPAQNTRDATALFKVWGIDGTVFAVGEAGLILQWTGQAWEARSAGPKANDDFVSLWGTSQDHMVAVGGRSGGRIATWDGHSWQTLAPSATPGLNAVYMTRPQEALVGGIVGYAGVFEPATGALVQEEPDTNRTIHAIWCDGEGRCYAVGGLFNAPWAGLALVRSVQG